MDLEILSLRSLSFYIRKNLILKLYGYFIMVKEFVEEKNFQI